MKKRYLILSLIFVLIALLALFFMLLKKKPADVSTGTESAFEVMPETEQGKTESVEEDKNPDQISASETPYQSPIDFAELKNQNQDIYAWLQIPGTDISYAVLQNADDDTLYLNHDENGNNSKTGALFTEHKYNNTDFSDPVTIIYGHHMRSGKMFGNLQQYYIDNFEEYQELIIYTPLEEIRYKVFAAVEFSNKHILYYYDCFKNKLMLKEFIDELRSVRAFGSYIDKEVEISENDQLLVLSTCLQGDRTSRFLVIGKRIE